MNRLSSIVLMALILAASAGFSRASDNYFVGGLGGFAKLSADHRAIVGADSSVTTAYSTFNGPAFMIYFGRHLTDHLSGQITYGWNRNGLSLSSVRYDAGGGSSYEESRDCSQQSVIADFMLYFRGRRSFARPYLSVGAGWTRLLSSLKRIDAMDGFPSLPPGKFSSTSPALRVAVGIDIFAWKNWAFRYSFAETLRSNAISQQLAPPAPHNLANFQNLFGLTWQF